MASSITAEHIKLMKSETLLDTPDGGGRMTTEEIAAGESNNLFPDTSSLDRVYGRLNLRKTFLSVQTQDTDSLMGANVIVAKKPEDPHIDVTLFSTRDWFDRRSSAQNLMEQYVSRGTLWAGHLLETQLKGQRSIQIACRQGDEEPKVDQCLYLVGNEGLASEFYQYVRVEKVTSRMRAFTVNGGEVVRKVITIETTVPLRYTFTGCTVQEYEQGKVPAAKLRDTQVADAARYYGTRPLAAAANIEDRNIQADSVFAQLVPTTQAETVIANHNAAGLKEIDASAGKKITVRPSYAYNGNTAVFTIGIPVLKGSVLANRDGGGATEELFDENGSIIYKATGKQVGRIEYSSGIMYLDASYSFNYVDITFTPAYEVISPTHTDIIRITQDARGYNYVKTLLPKPVEGTLSLSYESLGTVYYMYDNGRGEIKGANDGIGSGMIDYTSGTVTFSTGALPDADSAILFSWQSNSDAIVRDVDLDFYYALPLPEGVYPYGNLEISSWDSGATVDGSKIIYKGETIGYYDAQEKALKLSINYTSSPKFSWSSSPLFEHSAAYPPQSPDKILPTTVTLTFNKSFEFRQARTEERGGWGIDFFVDVYTVISAETITDDGQGYLVQSGVVVGTVDYNTHAVVLDPYKLQVTANVTNYKGIGGDTSIHSGALGQSIKSSVFNTINPRELAAAFSMTFRKAGIDDKSGRANLSATHVEAKLPEYYGYGIKIPKGVTFNSKFHAANSDGVINIAGGSLISFDTVAKKVIMKNESRLLSNPNRIVQASIVYVKNDKIGVSGFHFRAPANPLRAGSVQVMFQHEGKMLSYVADAQGRLDGEHITGTVDYKTGVVSANFKTKVQTDDGEKETDLPVDVSTLRFNAVAFRNIPLDAELLGIDPVRLPSDGRVPVFRNGNVAVVHNTQSYRLNTPAAGKVYNVGRTRLSAVKVYDGNGKALDSAMYSCDLDAGTLTLTPSFRADGLQLPLTAEHRIEDMGMVSDVQINGLVSLTTPLTHDYPKEGTMISSALIAGDLQARAYNVFTQRTWSNAWADSSTDVVTAKYDTANHPITVLNDGATEERWAFIFTNSTAFRIVGENLGQIGEGSTNTVTAPINPITGKPYFSIPSGGWGGGWSSGMVMRFNTAAANYPVWVARTVLPGQSSHLEDKFCLMVRGDVDR